MVVGNGKEDFNISSINGHQVKINGIIPGAGGAIPAVGDIDFIGNLNCNDVGGGGAKGVITAQKKVVSQGNIEVNTGDIDIKGNGNLNLEGNGNINQQGTGKISSGTAGIESRGDITTIGAHDLVIGRNIFFDGQDIYHRTFDPEAQETYKDFKQLPGKNDNNIYTGSNKFRSSALSIQALNDADPAVYEDKITLNTNGNIQCSTINNVTTIQCGNINCGNSNLNEVRARVFKTRTNENNLPDGWTITQETPNVPAQEIDRVLQIKGGEVNSYIAINDNAHSGFIPNIKLDPRTTALGGLIAASSYEIGQDTQAYKLEQPPTGSESNNLLIKAGVGEGQIKFQNNAGNIDLAIIQKDSVTNQGRLYCPAIFLGLQGFIIVL